MITKLNITYDVDRLWQACSAIIDAYGWGENRYISLTHRPQTIDSLSRLREPGACDLHRDGSPRTNQERGIDPAEPEVHEAHFTVLNEICRGTYIEQVLQSFPRLGTVRIIRLPRHHCYCIHCDMTMRIHLPLITNHQALMIFPDESLAVHLPANGHAYLLDTTKPHSAMNGGPDRYHIVGALLN